MSSAIRRVAIITGTRAEYGLLEPVMNAVEAHPALELNVIVAGSHFLPPAETWREVEAAWAHRLTGEVPMQQSADLGRFNDPLALSHGVTGLARVFEQTSPHWVVVLGDRIEAFAAALAGALGRAAVAHLHGGDRAEGACDESIRHAITKLAHLHLPASESSAQRIIRMGERPESVHNVGSPAIDALRAMPALDEASWNELGQPDTILLFHPIGDSAEVEERRAAMACDALKGRRVLWLHPNHDQGRDGVMAACQAAATANNWIQRDHLPRGRFIGALRRLASSGGVVVGNSSAGLIECAAIGVPVVDIGERQAGRERPNHAIHVEASSIDAITDAVGAALRLNRSGFTHPYGDGTCGTRAAELLARIDPEDRSLLRKRCTY